MEARVKPFSFWFSLSVVQRCFQEAFQVETQCGQSCGPKRDSLALGRLSNVTAWNEYHEDIVAEGYLGGGVC